MSFICKIIFLAEANGVITGFIIEYFQADDHDSPPQSSDFSPSDRNGTITNLIPGKKYIFKIKARTRIGGGNWVVWEQDMPIWAPPVPDRRSIATIISRTMTTVTLRFRRAYFSDEHGQVQAYAIGKF